MMDLDIRETVCIELAGGPSHRLCVGSIGSSSTWAFRASPTCQCLTQNLTFTQRDVEIGRINIARMFSVWVTTGNLKANAAVPGL